MDVVESENAGSLAALREKIVMDLNVLGDQLDQVFSRQKKMKQITLGSATILDCFFG